MLEDLAVEDKDEAVLRHAQGHYETAESVEHGDQQILESLLGDDVDGNVEDGEGKSTGVDAQQAVYFDLEAVDL